MALLPFPALVPDFPLLAGKLVEELDVVVTAVAVAGKLVEELDVVAAVVVAAVVVAAVVVAAVVVGGKG
jgi:hypothetical protein